MFHFWDFTLCTVAINNQIYLGSLVPTTQSWAQYSILKPLPQTDIIYNLNCIKQSDKLIKLIILVPSVGGKNRYA